MFEHIKKPLASRRTFVLRMLKVLFASLMLLLLSLFIGMFGYHIYAGLNWTDSYLNAAMILGGMGPIDTTFSTASNPDSAKIFAGTYAIFCGVIFLICFAIIIAPVIHRVLHKFHIESGKE